MFVKYPSETADKRRNFGTVKFRSNEFRKFTPRQPGGYETGTQSLVVQNAVIRSFAISVYTSHHVVSVSKSVSNQAILGGGEEILQILDIHFQIVLTSKHAKGFR